MKLTSKILYGLLFSTFAVNAQGASFYLGGGLGASNDSAREKAYASYRLFGGVKISAGSAFEIGYYDFSPRDSNARLDYGFSYTYKGNIWFNEFFSLIFQLGGMNWIDKDPAGTSPTHSPTVGLGLEYEQTDNLRLRFDGGVFQDIFTNDADSASHWYLYTNLMYIF